MRRSLMLTMAMTLLLALVAPASMAGGLTADQAFDRLKDMAGTWTGPMKGEGAEAEAEEHEDMQAVHEFRVSAAGTVVMETMGPGTEHEMINMYHVDGEDLVLTHYCAGGNQPTMRLNLRSSTPDVLVFDFTGGTNLDPATDEHIHAAKISFEGNRVISRWIAWKGGEQTGTMTFELSRNN